MYDVYCIIISTNNALLCYQDGVTDMETIDKKVKDSNLDHISTHLKLCFYDE